MGEGEGGRVPPQERGDVKEPENVLEPQIVNGRMTKEGLEKLIVYLESGKYGDKVGAALEPESPGIIDVLKEVAEGTVDKDELLQYAKEKLEVMSGEG